MSVKIIECPRDAMQGIQKHIPAKQKAAYLNTLLKIGFHTLDFGSFVSPKAIPQMADTAEVLSMLDTSHSSTKLLAIIANLRGAEEACAYKEINYLGYPFSVSETFQQRNTNAGIKDSYERIKQLLELCSKHNKELVIYISMAFGNPYGDDWNEDIVCSYSHELARLGVSILALSDTIGVAQASSIEKLFTTLLPALPNVEFGAHLHTTPHTWEEKVKAAYAAGCRRFDGAIGGYGGCPMAKDELTGNMPTEKMVYWLEENGIKTGLDRNMLKEAIEQATFTMG